jgi:hypothetical protein
MPSPRVSDINDETADVVACVIGERTGVWIEDKDIGGLCQTLQSFLVDRWYLPEEGVEPAVSHD